MPSPRSVSQMLRRKGRAAVLRRVVSAGVYIDAVAYVILHGGSPNSLVGSVEQSSFRCIIEAKALLNASWPAPPRDNDRIVFLNDSGVIDQIFTVMGTSDDRFAGSDLVAHVVQARG